MPQMAPINWLSLFFIMLLTFLMMNMLNYFTFSINKPKINKDKIINKNNLFNWKW